MALFKKKNEETNPEDKLLEAAEAVDESIEEDNKKGKKKKDKEKNAKKIELSEDIQRLIFIFAGLILILISYFLIYQRLTDDNTLLQNEISRLNQEVATLQEMDAKKEDNLKEIDRMKAESETIISKYPVDVLEEDIMYFVDTLERVQTFDGYSQTFDEKQLVLSTENAQDQSAVNVAAESVNDTSEVEAAQAEADGESQAPVGTNTGGTPVNNNTGNGYTLYGVQNTVDYRSGYTDLKTVINEILNSSKKRSIKSIDMIFDAETAMINGTMIIMDYAMEGTGKEYEPSPIEAVTQGKDNPFGTVQ